MALASGCSAGDQPLQASQWSALWRPGACLPGVAMAEPSMATRRSCSLQKCVSSLDTHRLLIPTGEKDSTGLMKWQTDKTVLSVLGLLIERPRSPTAFKTHRLCNCSGHLSAPRVCYNLLHDTPNLGTGCTPELKSQTKNRVSGWEFPSRLGFPIDFPCLASLTPHAITLPRVRSRQPEWEKVLETSVLNDWIWDQKTIHLNN